MARILIIDDHSGIRDLLVTALATDGHTVQVAHDGSHGLQAFAAHRHDLVVTDLYMPDMDGLEVISLLQREHPGVPAIVMSGGFGDHTRRRLEIASEFGAATVLRKPFHLSTLLEAVNRALRRSGAPEASVEPFAPMPELAAV